MNLEPEVLGDPVLVDDLADPDADGVPPPEPAARHHAPHLLELLGRGGEQGVPLMRP